MIKNIFEKLDTIEHLPSHPAVKKMTDGILHTVDLNSDTGINRLADVVSLDPSLSMGLLKIANSDAYGFKNKISSIKHALLILDNDLIRLVIEQHPSLPDLKMYDEPVEREFSRILRHSIEVHAVAETVLNHLKRHNPLIGTIHDDIVTAALLHDVGFLFLLSYFPDYYFAVIGSLRSMNKKPGTMGGIKIPDHSTIGALLGGFWQMPTFVNSCIAFHHYPWVQGNDQKVLLGAEILFVCDSLSKTYYMIFHEENDIFTIQENIIIRRNLIEIIEKFGIDAGKIPEIMSTSEAKMEARIKGTAGDMGFNFPAA